MPRGAYIFIGDTALPTTLQWREWGLVSIIEVKGYEESTNTLCFPRLKPRQDYLICLGILYGIEEDRYYEKVF
ncbi:hypothetical protein ACFLWX_04580 [Chloroflexota bacterium]